MKDLLLFTIHCITHAVSLTPSDLGVLLVMLKDVEADWRELSSKLEIRPESCTSFGNMLDKWLYQDHPHTWRQLLSALRAIGHTALADQIDSGNAAL